MTTLTTKSTPSMQTLFRWRCTCGRYGVWLERPEVARTNGRTHQHSEHGSQERYS